MITSQDLEDLNLLKVLQQSGEWREFKELREQIRRSFSHVFELTENLYSLSRAFMEGMHQLRELIQKEDEIKEKILKNIEKNLINRGKSS